MASEVLGNAMDIYGTFLWCYIMQFNDTKLLAGGIDLRFPHHGKTQHGRHMIIGADLSRQRIRPVGSLLVSHLIRRSSTVGELLHSYGASEVSSPPSSILIANILLAFKE
jgi:hypothetical protein